MPVGDVTVQEYADYMSDWSQENHMKNNVKKTNDMIVCFARSGPEFIPIYIDATSIVKGKES